MGNDKLHLRHPLFPFFSFFLHLLSSQCSFLCTSVLISPLCPFPLRVRQIPCPCPTFSFPVSSSRRQTGYMNPHGNRTPGCWEQDSQALGIGFPGVGNNRPGIQGHLCNVVCCFWSECFPYKPSERQERGLRAAVIIRFVPFYFAVHALCRTFAVQSRST